MSRTRKDGTEIAVKFGGVSLGPQAARLAVKIDRGASGMTISQVDRLVNGARLDVVAQVIDADVEDGQTEIEIAGKPVAAGPQITNVADCKSISATPDQFSISLSFSVSDISAEVLGRFVGKAGKVTLTRVGDAEGHADELSTADGAETTPALALAGSGT